jgi:hypothetical protein
MYESYYLRAAHPNDAFAVWIRYTVQKAAGKAPRASLWFTFFDESTGRPTAEKADFDAPDLSAPDAGWIRIGDSTFSETRIEGSSGQASWSIRVEDAARPLRHLPRPFLYKTPLPKTKPESPVPFGRFSGTVDIGDRHYELDRWPGMLGHNWGAEHAWTWVWLNGAGFREEPEAWIDVVMGRLMVAGRPTPWVVNGAISLDGERHRLGGPFRRGVQANPVPGSATLVLPGEGGLRAEVEILAPHGSTVAWNYGGPDGHLHDVLNCSMAELTIGLTTGNAPTRTLSTDHGGTYELGLPDRQEWLEVEPYPDLW